jgi:hypothetical protein
MRGLDMAGVRWWGATPIVGAAVVLLSVAGAAAGAAQVPDHRAVGEIEQVLRDRLAASAVPGAAFVVVYPEGASIVRGRCGTHRGRRRGHGPNPVRDRLDVEVLHRSGRHAAGR